MSKGHSEFPLKLSADSPRKALYFINESNKERTDIRQKGSEMGQDLKHGRCNMTYQ